MPPQITDYGNSYVHWTSIFNAEDTRKPGHMPWNNTVRILLDSRCWITDEAGQTREYNMISPCRTEWMYRSDILWQQPNYEFAGIYSATQWLVGHIRAGDENEFGGDWRVARNIDDCFSDFRTDARYHPQVEELENDEQVVAATLSSQPIVARTKVWSADEKTRAVIEYPMKTMNVQLERQRMQVDTGPLIYPDLDSDEGSEIKKLHFAFVCFNVNDVAEFVLRGPTPLMRDGKEVGTYIDYSNVRRVPIKNTFYAARQS